MSMDDDEDEIKDDSADDYLSIVDYLMFYNKLDHFILCHDWQNIELHLQTEEGTREANTAVFEDLIQEWFPLHLVYLTGKILPPTLRAPSLMHHVMFQLQHF
jgi:hypothetical protein